MSDLPSLGRRPLLAAAALLCLQTRPARAVSATLSLQQMVDRWAGGPGQTFYETEKNPGIARYATQYPHCSRAYGAWAVDFLKTAKATGKPFCLSVSFKAPHLPFTPDPQDAKLYAGKKFSRPPNYGVDRGRHLSAQARTSRAATGYREWINDYDNSAAAYYALITGIDAAVGMIREALTREGLAANTVIVYTADNGYSMGAYTIFSWCWWWSKLGSSNRICRGRSNSYGNF